MKRLIIFLVLSLSLAGVITAYMMYNKPHVNVSKEAVDIDTTIESIASDFQQNQPEAVKKYSDKIILLSGTYQSLSFSENQIGNLVIYGDQQLANCELDTLFNNKSLSFSVGDSVRVKGLFVGYDDLLGELQLKKCIIIE